MKKNKLNILAIDDEADFVDMLKQYFETRNYNIDISLDGNSGMELFRKNRYDVVLLDLKMSGGGDELMKQLRETHTAVSMIVVTAFKDSGAVKSRLLDEGVYAYVEKPVASLKDLEKLVIKASNEGEEAVSG